MWWPLVDHMNVTSYLIQFQSDDPINFTEHVIGTTKEIDEFQTWEDIAGHLTTVSAVTKVHPQPEINGSGGKTKSGTRSSRLITELRVGGNVSGVLIPNTVEIVVRILVPVVDEDGEMIQDSRFVEWKKVGAIRSNNNFDFFFFWFHILFLFRTTDTRYSGSSDEISICQQRYASCDFCDIRPKTSLR